MTEKISETAKCSCIKKIIIDNHGKVLIIPDFKLLANPEYSETPLEGCFCPRTSMELIKCLKGCMDKISTGNKKVTSFYILDESGNEINFIEKD